MNHEDSSICHPAFARLTRAYKTPVYTFLRRHGHDRQKAEDLTQDFFAYLWQAKVVEKADPARGRFRCFLLGVLKNFVAHEQGRQKTLKRGAGVKIFSIDAEEAEVFLGNDAATRETPERIFDRRWALAVLEQTMDLLRAECQADGMGKEMFDSIEPYLVGEQDASFAELGTVLGKTEGAVRVEVCRLRKRFRELIRAVIADTVTNVDDLEAELAHFKAVLRG